MKTLTLPTSLIFLIAASAVYAGDWGEGADDKSFEAMLNSGFKDKGIAKLARLQQDATQAFCSDPETANSPALAKKREEIETMNLTTVQWPSDGKWLGDWKEGEKIAQSGRGLTWSDKPGVPNGGNCYNCHQISKQEIAYGTIGPSLLSYGETHVQSKETLRYTWTKIYNAKATNACSLMPRGGHMGIITERQIQDVMALLFDPESPVNK